jgi:hypothetical protein
MHSPLVVSSFGRGSSYYYPAWVGLLAYQHGEVSGVLHVRQNLQWEHHVQ